MTDLEFLRKIALEATPGPWKYDWGNWEVEGPRPERYAICTLTPDARRPGFHGQEPNPVDGPGDGQFIAAFNPQVALELIERCERAERVMNALGSVLSEDGVRTHLSCFVRGVEALNRLAAYDASVADARKGEK